MSHGDCSTSCAHCAQSSLETRDNALDLTTGPCTWITSQEFTSFLYVEPPGGFFTQEDRRKAVYTRGVFTQGWARIPRRPLELNEENAARRIQCELESRGRSDINMCVGGHIAGGTGTQPTPNSVLPPGSTRVSGRASALLGVAGPSLATHRPLLRGGPTYYLLHTLQWAHL